MVKNKLIEWALRISIACTFIGHGVFALNVNPKWLNYLTTIGFSLDMARYIMPYIGVLDIFVGLHTIALPRKYILIWATFWAFSAALIRPISGEPIWSFIERAANWTAPLVLLLIIHQKNNKPNPHIKVPQ
ncbi:MAG: hypothetical protein OEX02_15780 [Cyclobacteriaceae bacterium]|nr:hypothetical protein [Cyclobacteriaceae bacterium]